MMTDFQNFRRRLKQCIRLLDKLPNSYAFTKALGEALVVEQMEQGYPAVVARPSIGPHHHQMYLTRPNKPNEHKPVGLTNSYCKVTLSIFRLLSSVIPIWGEPIPGWTDNINGPTGLLIGAGKGVIRSMYCKSNSYADFLPVDIFINGIMIGVWNYLVCGSVFAKHQGYQDQHRELHQLSGNKGHLVRNDRRRPGDYFEPSASEQRRVTNDLLNAFSRYPGGSMKHSRLYHNICALFFHWIPAVIIDTLLICLGYKPILLRVHRRISKGFEVFEYYTNNQWDFKSDIAQNIRKKLNARERREYKVDASGVDISKYFEDCIKAARIYILKEYDDTLPAARRHMKVMWFVDLVVRCLFWGWILYLCSGWLTSFFNLFTSSTDV
ncbi:Putative fatty acyl-CoA reductase CG5065 [Eumeta japonica]|uniref:Fatty acyl-CoA reductase n=1 Tax=Eumeta variegata TaxID=151549 RepID=A0A4C1ZH18_EUMVA|nr:Putative fatty acyl-CoA reductase CG5065 [Eumeta japonica]